MIQLMIKVFQVRERIWVDGSEGRLDGGLRHRLVGQSGHRRRLPPRHVALAGRQKTNGWGSISILLKSEINGEKTQFNSISIFVQKHFGIILINFMWTTAGFISQVIFVMFQEDHFLQFYHQKLVGYLATLGTSPDTYPQIKMQI